MAKTRWKQ